MLTSMRDAGASDDDAEKGKLARRMRKEQENYCLRDGVLMRWTEDASGSGRPVLAVVVPASQRHALLLAAHDQLLHMARATMDALRHSGAWWPNMEASVRDHIRNCATCCFNKSGRHIGQMHVPVNGFRPWSVVAVDSGSGGDGERQ